MARYHLKRYLGIVFIVIVIAPAIVLSFLALRAISHEEAYIEKQIEGTLSAEVAHVAGLVRSELVAIQAELAGTVSPPASEDPSASFQEWRRASALVDIPFLLSPDYEILWPALGTGAEEGVEVSAGSDPEDQDPGSEQQPVEDKEVLFLEAQEAFLSDAEKTPVYENIAVAYKDEILEEETSPRDIAGVFGATTTPSRERVETAGSMGADTLRMMAGQTPGGEVAARFERYVSNRIGTGEERGSADSVPPTYNETGRFLKLSARSSPATTKGSQEGDSRDAGSSQVPVERTQAPGEEARRQSAISRFVESEEVRRKVYDKAEREGQQFVYRNVEIADETVDRVAMEAEDSHTEQVTPPEPVASDRGETLERTKGALGDAAAGDKSSEKQLTAARSAKPKKETQPPRPVLESRGHGRIRSAFISEPLSFSEIVAGGDRGIVPRMMDGNLQLLYWQRAGNGNIIGCLIDSVEIRERIIARLPGIYSAVRILTVLDEVGRPVITPPGHEDRDWRRPFVAEEISEALPRWEIAAYLTDPDIISSRAQVATSVMWILILMLFVSIVGGGILVVRSTYAEMRLAQQKTTFVANVSHELKTPLTSIRMFAEMLRDGRQPDKDKQKKYLDIMTAETERLTRLVNNVLDFSRMERGEKRYTMKDVDIVTLVSGVVEGQRTRLEHNGFEVSFSQRTGPVTVEADEEALKQALVNLLSNAEKYSVETREIEVSVREEAGGAVICVSDRGVGVPQAEAETIFEEFYRVDDTLTSKVKGAGLGLTIARRILKDHGGDIRLRSREGGGSAFEIVLPLAGGNP